MRSVIAVIASVLVFGISWLFVGGIFDLLGWVLVKTGYASAPVLLIHLFLMWILTPGFAAAISITTTNSFFRTVPQSTIYVGFISVCATAFTLLALVGYHQNQTFGALVVSFFQAAAVFLGARLSRHLSSPLGGEKNAPASKTDALPERTDDAMISAARTDTISVGTRTPQAEPSKITAPEQRKRTAEPETEPSTPARLRGSTSSSSSIGQARTSIEVTNEFQAAIEFVNQRRGNLFITGRAGTGKSTLLRQIRDVRTGSVAVLAPTGLAAVNVGGQTIHSFFKFKPGLLRPEDVRMSRNAAMYRSLDTIIIDEISMVRADLMEAIDRFLRINRGRPSDPFGGVQVVLVGDLHQLPPVVDDPQVARYLQVQFGGVYFFNAGAFQASQLHYSELTKKCRQSDSVFAGILDRIAEGACDSSDLRLLNENVTNIDEIPSGGQCVILAPRNRTVFDLNMRFLNALAGPEKEMVALVEGDFEASSFPTDQSLRLKVGAKVILLRNDSSRRWVNGTMTTVARLENGRVWISLRGAEHELEREVWEKIRYEYDEERKTIVGKAVGSFKQFPLRLGWAMTIHKSQGMTLENTYLDLDGGSFTHGQTYVALSRSRSLSGLRLARPLLASDVIFDKAAVGYRGLGRPMSLR